MSLWLTNVSSLFRRYVRLSLPRDPEIDSSAFADSDDEDNDLTEEAFDLSAQRGKILSGSDTPG